MPRITYRRPDGTAQTHDVPVGLSVMRGAVLHGVEGIVAECGGACSCGTCHVYVAGRCPALPPMDALEDDVLHGVASPRRPDSRLACQLTVTEELDGLLVDLPPRQT